jgi:hypothetical protein
VLLTVRHQKLIDKVTSLSGIASISSCQQAPLNTIDFSNKYSNLLLKFPNITKPICFKEAPRHSVVHHIETTGTPVYARPRPLPPDKYNKVKVEFQRMMDMGIYYIDPQKAIGPLLYM